MSAPAARLVRAGITLRLFETTTAPWFLIDVETAMKGAQPGIVARNQPVV
jgi:hypothetical protein